MFSCKHLSALIEHIQKLEILYEFDVRFHTNARKSNLSCFIDCAKHASTTDSTTDNSLDFYTNKTKQQLQTKPS